ncbi:hypothetical protein NP233_g3909 [Leucocoprinus birnbaumii]|uniref:Glutamine synthetase n=1 Tax=Leucocoprinus birnbaumii TaxID=56174 RepID=A0AAD5VVQ2_9AGAR|nr:hypothetical protein NP233_g3909 [Leucocoprinus birnbaumii]
MSDNYDHGVTFKPDNIEKVVYDLNQLDLEHSYRYVRVYWVDLANVKRCRIVTLNYFKQMLASNRPGVNIGKVGLGSIYLNLAPGFTVIGEYVYVPDISTLRPLPWTKGHLGVVGTFEEKTPYKRPDGSLSLEVELCPRTVLRKVVEDAKQSCNVEFLVGVESEFILLSSTNPVKAPNDHQWSASDGFLAGTKEETILQEIGDAMLDSGLSLQMIHSEAAPGQYEVVGGPLSPLDAADQVIFTRELIVNIASKHGLRATFSPRPFMESPGSAAHIHISVHSADEPTKPINEMSKAESAFLAGVIGHLPALPAVTLPTPASYKRMTDGIFSGGTFVHYGTENREAPIRLTNATSPKSRNFEMRFIDETANPYLALAAILGAGVIGIKEKKPLEIKDCPGPLCAWQMTEEERRALGITKRMPLDIEEARNNFKGDAGITAVFGTELVEKYLSVNKTLEGALLEGGDEAVHMKRIVELY